ncbi:hypothetical protein FD725_21795 [Nostoc sp. TCL26-01]|nr:hypothetical protein FD725_21795 [Nostoc sp. TCL26-01]
MAPQPCILREVVDRPNLGHHRPLCSKGHYKNLSHSFPHSLTQHGLHRPASALGAAMPVRVASP